MRKTNPSKRIRPISSGLTSVQTRRLITTGAFAGLGFMGISRAFLGTALPAIRTTFGLNLFQAGGLPAMMQLGFSIAVFIGGPLSDLLNKKRLLMVGLFLLGGSLVLFGTSVLFWVNLTILALMGIGGGLIESSSNPLLIRLFPGRESAVMNLHHFFYAAGSLVGPLVMGIILARETPWRWGYLGFGCVVMLTLLGLGFSGGISTERDRAFNLAEIRRILGQRSLQTLFFLIFLSQGVQNGIGYWMVTFLGEVKGLSIGIASLSLSLFFLSLALGRLLTGFLITKLKEIPYTMGLLCLLSVSLFLSIVIKGYPAIVFFSLCGLFHSGVLPISLGVMGKIFSKNPGTPLGILVTSAGIGATVVPWLVSLIAQVTTLKNGFVALECFVLFSIALLWFNRNRMTLAEN